MIPSTSRTGLPHTVTPATVTDGLDDLSAEFLGATSGTASGEEGLENLDSLLFTILSKIGATIRDVEVCFLLLYYCDTHPSTT